MDEHAESVNNSEIEVAFKTRAARGLLEVHPVGAAKLVRGKPAQGFEPFGVVVGRLL